MLLERIEAGDKVDTASERFFRLAGRHGGPIYILSAFGRAELTARGKNHLAWLKTL